MPTQKPTPTPGSDTKGPARPGASETARRPAPQKPVVFKDFASI